MKHPYLGGGTFPLFLGTPGSNPCCRAAELSAEGGQRCWETGQASLEKPGAQRQKRDVSGLPQLLDTLGWLLAAFHESSGNTPALGNFEIPSFLAGWESCFLPGINPALVSTARAERGGDGHFYPCLAIFTPSGSHTSTGEWSQAGSTGHPEGRARQSFTLRSLLPPQTQARRD